MQVTNGDGATLPGPALGPRLGAGPGGPAAAWYFVYLLYIFVYILINWYSICIKFVLNRSMRLGVKSYFVHSLFHHLRDLNPQIFALQLPEHGLHGIDGVLGIGQQLVNLQLSDDISSNTKRSPFGAVLVVFLWGFIVNR